MLAQEAQTGTFLDKTEILHIRKQIKKGSFIFPIHMQGQEGIGVETCVWLECKRITIFKTKTKQTKNQEAVNKYSTSASVSHMLL